jgi:hypothetical protein
MEVDSNRYGVDVALFVTRERLAYFKDLKFSALKFDYGIGIRFHGPAMTPLRFDVARSDEGWNFVISSSAAF